jgi:hypothetical protein
MDISSRLRSTTPAQSSNANSLHRRNSKLDQWICFWSIPVFYVFFGIVFVYLTRTMPPPSANVGADGAIGFFQSVAGVAHTRIGFALLVFSLGFYAMNNALVVVQMKRMEGVSQAMAYAYIVVLSLGALPGCMFIAIVYAVAAMRPDRDPQLVSMLYDMGMLSYVGSLGCFVAQYVVFIVGVLLDKRRIFPKWIAYFSVWVIFTEVLAGPIFAFKSGPLAWNGAISFWLGTAVWVFWQFCFTVCLYKAIKQQPLDEVIPA